MKFSYKEIQSHIDKKLPTPEKLAKELTDKAFEVEEIVPSNDDFLLEVKVLPDRPDCKKIEGLSLEVAAILNLPVSETLLPKQTRTQIVFSVEEINSILGLKLKEKEIIKFLNRLYINVKNENGKLIAEIPDFRVDVNISEDLADEIGRLYGIDKIPGVPLPKMQTQPKLNPIFTLTNTLRQNLLDQGFTEIYGYTLASKGEIETEKPLASDKAFLRTNLTDGLKEKLNLNLQNNIFDQVPVKIFEIGAVWSGGQEKLNLGVAIGFKSAKFKKTGLSGQGLPSQTGKLTSDETSEILEVDLEEMKNQIALLGDKTIFESLRNYIHDIEFKQFSLQPMIVRDIALWVESSVSSQKVSDLIKKNAGELLVQGPFIFDEFKKEEKTSYAFRLVFQSLEKTLTDIEVEEFMKKIKEAVLKRGWEVR